MDVVFEGSLSKSWGMKDVLLAIRELPNVQLGLLRISCSSRSIQGKILFTQAKHILGASGTEATVQAYELLKALLQVKEGNFAYLDISDEAAGDDIDQSLFIDITRVLESWPQLPEHSTDLFDQSTLLDKVFGLNKQPTVQPPVQAPQATREQIAVNIAPRQLKPRKEALPEMPPTKKVVAPPITQWNVVESLLENPQAAHTDHAECPVTGASKGMIPQFVQTADEQRSSMNKLRALPESSEPSTQWQRFIKQQSSIKWLLAALGLSVLIFLIGQQIPDSNAPAQNQRVAASSAQIAH